jgi:hypothetical protein
MQRYTLRDGALDPDQLDKERAALTGAITATLGAWRGRKASPVYAQLPNLCEPDWKTLKVGDVNELWEALEKWQSRIEIARLKQRPGDILVLADETPNRTLEFEALKAAAKALIDLRRPRLLAPLCIRSYLLMSRSSPRSGQLERALRSGFGGARRERGRRPRLQLISRIRTAVRRRG